MEWEILFCDEFEVEYLKLPRSLRVELSAHIGTLKKFGPSLGRPLVDTLKQSKLKNMKELRFLHDRQPYRYLFAFDPKRRAIVLVGGSKANDKRFYEKNIPIAEKRFRKHFDNEGK